LDGTHPVFTQVPPMVPRSIITTEAPESLAVIAAANAAPPEPMIARSKPDRGPVTDMPPHAGPGKRWRAILFYTR